MSSESSAHGIDSSHICFRILESTLDFVGNPRIHRFSASGLPLLLRIVLYQYIDIQVGELESHRDCFVLVSCPDPSMSLIIDTLATWQVKTVVPPFLGLTYNCRFSLVLGSTQVIGRLLICLWSCALLRQYYLISWHCAGKKPRVWLTQKQVCLVSLRPVLR